MIIETLTKLDRSKRIAIAALVVSVAVFICYYAITDGSVAKLQAVNAKHASMQMVYAGTATRQAGLMDLRKELDDISQQVAQYRRQCFSFEQALQFFEDINAMALAHNLSPISRIVSEPADIISKTDDEKDSQSQNKFLKIQSARVIVAGNYFNIVDFVIQLTKGPTAVSITGLRIALPPGEEYNPQLSFTVSVLVDLHEDTQE